ncbi:M15 family metallopeptidase [Pedobacter frigoris]|uniref:D-alanyl-D-alanine dipeptidase n=1 Tax=Pedobacter frigoris TaxID=2571272 RepID=A0A4U1CEL2_9SPHI|nr:M15 family metallopeptidase [Pedobacter frigoris]TKC04950.1 D-alanyl-D-alanine dipeptidase [Pedobacter frigoris]
MKSLAYLIAFFFYIVLSGFICLAQQNSENPYGLKIISSFQEYSTSYQSTPGYKLVELKKVIPNIVLDIRYASKNNFMKEVMYKQARAFARKPVAEQLKKIQSELNTKGYGLKIFDAYRPYAVTLAFYEKASDKRFVADPKKGSKHNRGCAIDLTLINLKTGKEIQMPTPYDSFQAAAAANYSKLPPNVIKNREMLISVMQKHGFRVIAHEWWHFDFVGWKNYPLMDIPFEKL